MLNICAFLGAGFSKWACNLPLVNDLFDWAIHVDSEVEQRRLDRISEAYKRWRFEHPTDHPERFIGFCQSKSRSKFLVNLYILRRLTDQFTYTGGRRSTFYINSYRAHEHDGARVAGEFFERIQFFGKLDIVTTNYDLLPEYALGSRSINFGIPGEQIGWTRYPHIRPVYANGGIRIAKLHGSLSWSESGEKATDSRHGLTGKSLIVPPISEKVPPTALLSQWSLASSILSNTDVFVVFGFSFNENDLAVRDLVATNLAGRAIVILVDAVDHRDRLPFLTLRRKTHFVNVLEVPTSDLANWVGQSIQ
ncbi:SIR2 family protein [Bauldia litoralis]|uniref:SIR2 family protein n=1 Tax=Bauldia litoralis TaxID=665467 RepID=UPI003D65EE5C